MPAAVTVTVTVTRDSVTATVPGAAVTPGAQPEAPWQWRLGLGVELESPNPTRRPGPGPGQSHCGGRCLRCTGNNLTSHVTSSLCGRRRRMPVRHGRPAGDSDTSSQLENHDEILTDVIRVIPVQIINFSELPSQ